MQLHANGPHTFAHHLDGASATARVPNFVQAMSGRCGDLLAGHVGDGARRLAENPGVDHDRLAAERADPVAHVLDLGALGSRVPINTICGTTAFPTKSSISRGPLSALTGRPRPGQALAACFSLFRKWVAESLT